MSQVHAQARTTPRTRAEIKASGESTGELAKRYNITRVTARKWKGRDTPEDLSHRPHTLHTTLTPVQEAITVELRCLLLLPLDDLLAVVREFINPDVSRAGLGRCLRRHGVSNLRELAAKARGVAGDGQDKVVKTFKDYEPGFVHMDIKYLPQMPDESQRRYLFVAIDRATRWVFMHIYADQSENSSVDFLERLELAAPMKIVKLLTDNGSQFTDRFTNKKREPSGRHKFDVRCKALGIEHRLCPPRHPQTNGMVERFNGRISEVVQQTRFASAAQLEATLMNYVKIYNHQIPQRALQHISPVQALKNWQVKKPELFKKRVYKQAGLDSYAQNKRKDSGGPLANQGFDIAVLNNFWTGSSNGGFIEGNSPLNAANKREMFKVGFGYQITPQLNAGLHYYHAKQSGSNGGMYNGKADFIVAVADYAFSKRTDAYFGVDYTKTSGGSGVMLDINGATKRTGITVGLRHRF